MPSLRLIQLRRWSRWPGWGWLAVWIGAIAVLLHSSSPATASVPSDYDLARKAPFNQVETYPIKALPSTSNYRPTGEWVGRLVLPSVEEYGQKNGDWAWFEVWYAPIATPNLVGQKVQLTWTPGAQTEAYVHTVTRDVKFTQQTRQAADEGILVPDRLDGRRAVGPLQSLAGSRPKDDVTVRLVAAKLVFEGETPVVQTGLEPVLVTGREYALVKILEPDSELKKPLPVACPGGSPCPSEYFKVQHYNSGTGKFDGETETVRIPQQPKLGRDRFFSSIRDLPASPAGKAGWYIYGARDADKVFTVQALKPRSLFQLTPDTTLLGKAAALQYIKTDNWQEMPQQKGTLRRVLISPTAANPDEAVAAWQEGDYALVVHLMGGTEGQPQDAALGTVAGHFAYGLAQVIREPFTQELQLEVLYQELFPHNSMGILAGTYDWSAFMGDLQRGWMGQRPVSDLVVKLKSFENLDLAGPARSLFEDWLLQSQSVAARYRVGDGTGLAMVTPAVASVKDANQALYGVLAQAEQQADSNLAKGLTQQPPASSAQAIRQITQLSQKLSQPLVTYGGLLSDWADNSVLVGTHRPNPIPTSALRSLWNWRAMLPRRAQDEIGRFFLAQEADLWFLRTNVLGGIDPTLEPLAPTLLLGKTPWLSQALRRLADATAQPSLATVAIAIGTLVVYGAIAWPYGFRSKFLRRQIAIRNPLALGVAVGRLIILPALVEEILFRVLLLPHPSEGLPLGQWWLWAALSLGLFIPYHWLSAYTYYKSGNPTFLDRRFVLLMAWLGIVLTLAYRVTGSLWVVTFVHWVVVAAWLYGLGGYARLFSKKPQKNWAMSTPKPV